MDLVERLKKKNVEIPIRHVSNSSAVISYPEMNLELVRVGILMYGLYPSELVDKTRVRLKPAMQLKSTIINISHVPQDSYISYGMTFRTERDSLIATLPVGYADGYPRIISNRGHVLVGGVRVPLVGNICMDHFMVDVTDMDGKVSMGGEAVLFGRQLEEEIEAGEVAGLAGTIHYEILSRIGLRVPRVYMREGRVVNKCHYLL
jgi:alanine racemase